MATTTSRVPSPEAFLGFEPGAERVLADWPQIVEYFRALAGGCDRVQLQELGKTTNGNPFILAIFASPQTLARLDEHRDSLARLYDPRRSNADEAAELIARLPVPVLVTSSVHATEVGPAQSSVLIGHRMATADDEDTRGILDNVIFLYVPSLNPDGLRIVKAWYDRTLGTPHEGSQPPELYHKYVGHDNNRDWFMFTQAETRLTIEKIHNVWHPVIVYDQHQMGRDGVRMMVPPFVDPYDPFIDPILVQETASTGLAMATELTSQGKAGITVNAIFDGYSPSRQYQYYHGGIRILSELASAKLATSVDLKREDLREGRGVNPRERSWAQPLPWGGGTWRLSDIVEYNVAGAFALLGHAARYRDRFLRNLRLFAEHGVENASAPAAFIVPASQPDPSAAAEMLEALRFGDVELQQASERFTADDVSYPAGTVVVPLAQPASSYARTMLTTQNYPDLRQYPGGPPKPPYDVTAHSLPLMMGVRCAPVQRPISAKLEPLTRIPRQPGGLEGSPSASVFALSAESNASVKAVNALLAAGAAVSRTAERLKPHGEDLGAGAFVAQGVEAAIVRQMGERHAVRFHALDAQPSTQRVRAPRIGLYASWLPNMDEGWTRFILEEYGFAYTTLHDADVRQGGLRSRFDCIVLPQQSPEGIQNGAPTSEYPPEYCGGLGATGAASMREFVSKGGTLIALDSASNWAIEQLALPVQDVLRGVSQQEFYVPGSLLRVVLDTRHPIAWGMPREVTGMFLNSPAFDVKDGAIIGRYPWNAPLAAGWLRGGERIQGRAALVEQRVDEGRVLLFGLRAQFRAQMRGTYRLLFNALYYATA